MRHTQSDCRGIHCKCMKLSLCSSYHFDDHVQDNGVTPKEQRELQERQDRPNTALCISSDCIHCYPRKYNGRRHRTDLLTPEEKAIHECVQAVEALGAHPFLTDAVVLLGKAKDALSNWVDHIQRV